MRKVILFVNLTLDGHLAGPNGELDWMLSRPDGQMNHEFSTAMIDRSDTILFGHNFYQGFEDHFRAEAANPASPPEYVEVATWLADAPKVVFARDADLPAEVAALKSQPGKDMVLFGGVRTAQRFARHGLIDEYWIKLYPVALGTGQPLFTEQDTNLELVDSKTYDSGIVTLRYRPAA